MPTVHGQNFNIRLAGEDDFDSILTVYEDNYDSFFCHRGQDLYVYILDAITNRRLKIAVDDNNNIIALITILKLTQEQVYRILNGGNVNPLTEDVTKGTIDFVANVWIIKFLRFDEAFLYKLHEEFTRLFGEVDFRGLRHNRIRNWNKIKDRFKRRFS